MSELKIVIIDFYKYCELFIININFLQTELPELYKNILNVITNKKIKLIFQDLEKYENYNSISDFLYYNQKINELINCIMIFQNLINFDVEQFHNLTNTTKYNYNIERSNMVGNINNFKNVFNNKLCNQNKQFINKLPATISNDDIKLVNDIYNNSFLIWTKYNKIKNILFDDEYVKIINIADGKKYDFINVYKIKNMVIQQYTSIFNKYINADNIITSLHEINKSNILNITNATFENKYIHQGNIPSIINIKPNNLQLYNLIPYSFHNCKSIKDIINKICNIDLKLSNNILQDLVNVCNIYSETINNNFVIIIIQHHGNMINYNINPLFDSSIQITHGNGLNSAIVNKMKTIEFEKDTTNINLVNRRELHVINYSNSKPNIGFVLDTNDMISYRLLINKNIINNISKQIVDNIDNSIFVTDETITKLLQTNKFNNRIESYNKLLENSILSKVKDNSISHFYSSVDTNYNIYVNSSMHSNFTNKIIDIMISNNVKLLEQHPNHSIITILNNETNIELFKTSIIIYYNNLQLESQAAYLTYLSLLENTVDKFKKELIDTYNSIELSDNESKISQITIIMKTVIENVINVKTHMTDAAIEKEQILIAFKNKNYY